MAERRSSISNDILSGQLLIKSGLFTHWRFILYIFLLILLYISFNMGVERTQIKKLKNEQELVWLRDEYSGKDAVLQNMSKRSQITAKLKELGSDVCNPTSPAIIVTAEE